MSLWLIRTALNEIQGPMAPEEVRKLITDGKLGLQDEICPANGYWILLHEREEVKRWLGIDVPFSVSDANEEATDTQTETLTDRTEVEPVLVAVPKPAGNAAQAGSSMMRNLPPRPLHLPPKAIERASFWQGIAWVLVTGVALVLYVVLKLIRSQAG